MAIHEVKALRLYAPNFLCSLGGNGRHERLKIFSFWGIGSIPIVNIFLFRNFQINYNLAYALTKHPYDE